MALRSNISKIRASLKPAVGRGVHRGASMVADLAKQLAPVDTGALRASIQVEPPQPGPERVAVTAGRGLPDPRAVVNEYGSSVINFPPRLATPWRRMSRCASSAPSLRCEA